MKFSKFFKFWFPVLFYSGIIFRVSSIPNLQSPLREFNADKLWHLGEYCILGFLFARAFVPRQTRFCMLSDKIVLGAVFLFCFLFGVSDEFHQSFVVGRSADWKDALADTIGGSFGGWIYLRLRASEYYQKFSQHGKI